MIDFPKNKQNTTIHSSPGHQEQVSTDNTTLFHQEIQQNNLSHLNDSPSQSSQDSEAVSYLNARLWQIAFFSLNNAATNLYLAMMGYVSYYANGIAGFSVVLVSFLLTALNIFDGITDPIIGYFLDKTNGRFGKFRPFMIIGNVLLAISCILLFFTTHLIPTWFRLPYFIFVYALYVIGYTFQTVVGKSGQTILTNNPEQRPISTYFDSMYIMASFGCVAFLVANYLTPKYGGFTSKHLFQEFTIIIIIASTLCTILSIVGIWEKDRKQFFFTEEAHQKIRFLDYWDILIHNKPIRMLILAACTVKFAATVYANTTVGVMLFGIMMKDYTIAGLIGAITGMPTLLVVTAGIRVAQKLGQKKALVLFTWAAIVMQFAMIALLTWGNLTDIRFRFTGISRTTILFLFIFILLNGCKSITNNMVVPMIADCSDYEVYRSGKYVPGLMGALFSFVDKVFTALGTAFVGLIVALIGFQKILPQIDDPLTPAIKSATIWMYCGIPIIGWLISLLALKFYSLDKEKMKEIQMKNITSRFKKSNNRDAKK